MALAAAALAAVALPQAQAAGVSGQGTWETTLQGRDLDGNAATFEAYYDTVLDITWLADANYAQTSGYDVDGLMAWDEAQFWVAQLDINGATGWRLPDVKPVNGSVFNANYSHAGDTDVGYNITSSHSELAHLYHVTLGNKSHVDASGDSQPDFGLQNTGPFSNVQSGIYWSGVGTSALSLAWYFNTSFGNQAYYYKDGEFSAWAVHSGDVAAAVVPEPQTYALAMAGLAVFGALARKRRA